MSSKKLDNAMSDTDQTRHLEMLVQIAQLLATLDLDEVLLQIIKLTTDTVGAARGSFFLLDERGHALQRFIAARNIDPQMRRAVSDIVLSTGLAGWVVTNQKTALVTDTTSDPRWITLEDDSEPRRVRSALCVPFFVNNALRGVMTLEHPEPMHFTPGDVRLVEAVANQASAALRNAQLFDRVQSQQRHLEAVLNSISEALLVVDHEWRLRMYNPEALRLLGAEHDNLADHRLIDLSSKYSKPMLIRLIEEIQTNVATHGRQTFDIRDETSGRDYVANVAILDNSSHNGVSFEHGYVIALHDVTSLKDLNRLKTHMIQMASHDLKNPIGVLRGYLDVIRSDTRSGLPPEPVFLENMYKAIGRMETLVSTLLDIQRAEQDSPLKRESIDPYELVQAVLDDMLPAATQHHHVVVKNIQANMRAIKGDFARLREVMNNLVENAIKYTPDGGQITITVFTEEERFCFNVKDVGYGIPGSQQANLFQPYFRARQEQTRGIGGTGLGLSLVKEGVERHGGQVWFTSIENHGSTFGFWLPLLT